MNLFQKLIKKAVDFLCKALPKEAEVEVRQANDVSPYRFMLEQLDRAYPTHVITADTPTDEVRFKAGQRQVIEWLRITSTKWR